jgi:RNA polymerase-binding protein DksA
MNAIDAHQIDRLRSALRERASTLREEIRQALLRSDQEPYVAIADRVRDTGDDALADLFVDINLAEIDRDVTELREVETALQGIAEGTYGSCVDCGEPIGYDRLTVNPSAARCLPCQEAHERMRVHTPTL